MDTTTPAARPRYGRTPRDMALSLVVLLIPVALLVGAYRVFYDGDKPVAVETTPVVEEARRAGLPALAPTGLPEGWVPVSAASQRAEDGQILRIGYLSPDRDGLQLVQSGEPADAVLTRELTAGARPQGEVTLGGRTWQRYSARPGESALVLLRPDLTVVVLGSTSDEELSRLAGSLR